MRHRTFSKANDTIKLKLNTPSYVVKIFILDQTPRLDETLLAGHPHLNN